MRGQKKPTNDQIFNLFKTIKEETDNMNFTLTSGKIETAKKVVIYGPEGIGKSTLASKFPGTVFIDTEGSTKELDVMRYPTPTEWFNILDEIDDCIINTPCKTLVIDTADWAEQLCSREVCKRLKVSGIEDVGYGKGYTYLKEEFSRLLKKCNDLVDRGVNVVFTAHAMMRKFEQPDEMGAYDRWEMKLSKQCSPLLKEWADIVLFCNYKTSVLTDANTKSKKATGGKRVMYASHHPCWDAKNRYGLPDQMDMSFEPIKHLFDMPIGWEEGIRKKNKEPDYRAELKAFINENDLDQMEIITACGLNKESTNKDYKKALEYAKEVKNNG